MSKTSAIHRAGVYAILIAGSIVFSFPFLWMASTSFKMDRELFRGQVDLRPDRPIPRTRSPYYDPRQYEFGERVAGPQAEALLPFLNGRAITTMRLQMPPAANMEELPGIVTTGMFQQLAARTPRNIWDGDAETLRSFAADGLKPGDVAQVAAAAFRQVGIGSFRARSDDLQSVELSAGAPPEQRNPASQRGARRESVTDPRTQETPRCKWNNLTPDVATLTDATDNSQPFAAVTYDFSKGDRLTLQNTFTLPFPASQLQRVQLRLRPDDTWHALRLTLESAGVRYVAERPQWLHSDRWITVTWQKPSDDDHSTKMKTWLVMYPTESGPQFNPGDRKIKATLEFRRQTPFQASLSKARYNFQRVVDQVPFWRYVRVSVLLVILNIVLTVLSSSLVAYAFARLQWPGRDAAFLVMLGTMMIPGQVTMIPNFLIWKTLGAYNTLVPLYAGAALGNAFFIFMMRQFLKGVPTDLEDAARIDGCGFLRIWWHVMLPLVKPSLAAIAIFTFMGTWNDFLGPLVYIADQRLYPLAFGLYAFNVQNTDNPVLMMAGSLLMTLPVIVVFFLTQRYFVQGITLTGMKG